MRCHLCAFLMLMLMAPVAAQDGPPRPGGAMPQTVIEGRVVAEDDDRPIENATVSVWQLPENRLATGAVTGADGRFRIERLRPGTYRTDVSFVGFATQHFEVELRPGNLQVDLGTIALVSDAAMIEEVEVTAERDAVQFAVDRTVYNVRDDPATTGGSVTDVLQNIPSVEVDMDGNVSLRGNQNVAIHMNGRPVPISGEFLSTFLQQIPASTIERIEVIPNPSARYDPEGMSGIINIITRQDVDRGIGGGVNIGIGTNDRYNASGNLNYQQGRLEVFANYGFRHDSRESTGFNFRENRFVTPYTYLEQDNRGLQRSTSHMFNASADYNVTRRDRLSVSGRIGNRDGAGEGRNEYRELDDDRDVDRIFERISGSDNDGLNMDVSLGYRRTIESSRHELSAEARFNRFAREAQDEYLQNLLQGEDSPAWTRAPEQRTWLDDQNDQWTFQVDYVRPLGETTRIETGVKSSMRRIDNDFWSESRPSEESAFVPDENLSNQFTYDEQVHAAYGIVNQQFGRIEAQLGTRVEQANTRFDLASTTGVFDNDYLSIFPSAFLAYSVSDATKLRASYSKRINRPHTRVLNPFTSYDDPLNLRRGNPELSPEYTHAFELGLTQFTGATSLTLTPYFRRTVDVIRQFKTVDEQGVSVTTFENMATSDSYGAELIGSLRMPGLFNAFASVSAYQVTTDGTNVDADVSSDAFGWSTRMNATFNIRRGTDLQFFWFYRSPLNIERGRMSSFSMSTLSLQQKFLNDRASVSIRVFDVFDTMGFRFESTGPNFYQESERDWQSQAVFLGFTYNFGQQPRPRPGRNRGETDSEGDMDQVQID